MKKPLQLEEVTLDSKRTVTFRPRRNADELAAAEMLPANIQDNKFAAALHLQTNLIRLLIVEVDGKPVKQSEMLSLDDMFDMDEIEQLRMHVGGDEKKVKRPIVALKSSGGNK